MESGIYVPSTASEPSSYGDVRFYVSWIEASYNSLIITDLSAVHHSRVMYDSQVICHLSAIVNPRVMSQYDFITQGLA